MTPLTTLRELAERILFGSTLADKLVSVHAVVDEAPGAPVRVERPGRPPELRFPAARLRDELPSLRQLDALRTRGELLHRFANHELLALELMAAAVLRFPDAPREFRFGLTRTLLDEQRHLRLYLERAAAFGVAVGDVPVNDFFWRAAADVESPWDYVLRVPLTIEQANLDFARTWREAFRAVGDDETAAILDVVYQDEVRHVAGGLRLFRAWCPPGRDEWDVWADGLRLPLSPARARGPDVDRDGRLAAGFTPAWVDRMVAHGGSRGRVPDVWVFNPSCEDEVARGRPGASPTAAVAALTADLAPLLLFLAPREDVVRLPVAPSARWLATLVDAGFTLPETAVHVAGRRVGRTRPWGVSPAQEGWRPSLRAAYSKVEAVAWRREVLGRDDEVGVCGTLAEVEAAAAHGWVVKAPFSTAGRGRRRGPLDENGRRWAARVLDEHGALRVEPWRERVLDLSFHFDLGARMRPVGVCRFVTTPEGRFVGADLGHWSGELRRFLYTGDRLRHTQARLAEVLGPALGHLGVEGPVGVDAFVWRDPSGQLHLDPLVEVNPRWTMGRVALALERRLHPWSTACWRFVDHPPDALGVRLEDGLLAEGRLATNDPSTATHVWTVLEISRQPGRSARPRAPTTSG